MSSKILKIAIALGLSLTMIFIMGCGDDSGKTPKSKSVTDEIVEQIVDQAFDSVKKGEPIDVVYTVDSMPDSEIVAEVEPNGETVFDFVTRDNKIIAVVKDGLLVHHITDGTNFLVPTEGRPGAILDLGEKVLIGGDNLYTFDGDRLTNEDFNFELSGRITALHRKGPRLYIGTTSALYEVKTGVVRELASDINITRITTDDYGLWVGTAGDGLYYWNGESFRKRYLRRDSTLFDNVTALASRHGHLYLGTDRGFFVYDGGRWAQYKSENGLPSEMVTAINADDWTIKIGTAEGAVTFFNNEFKPLDELAGKAVTALDLHGRKLIAGTVGEGLVMQSGGLLTTLYDGQPKAPVMALEESW